MLEAQAGGGQTAPAATDPVVAGLRETVAQLEQRFAGEINDPDPQRDSRRYVIVDLENNRPIT